MARINLLPWRAERRKSRQKEFVGMLGPVSYTHLDVYKRQQQKPAQQAGDAGHWHDFRLQRSRARSIE